MSNMSDISHVKQSCEEREIEAAKALAAKHSIDPMVLQLSIQVIRGWASVRGIDDLRIRNQVRDVVLISQDHAKRGIQ